VQTGGSRQKTADEAVDATAAHTASDTQRTLDTAVFAEMYSFSSVEISASSAGVLLAKKVHTSHHTTPRLPKI
jgi:hypothetical protein